MILSVVKLKESIENKGFKEYIERGKRMASIIENESYISDFEKENIVKILQNGYESDTLDFKEYAYHLDDDVNKKNSKVR